MGAAKPELTALESSAWLSARAAKRLAARVEQALRGATRGQVRIVSVSEPLRGDHDPCALVLRSRRPEDAWFCLEQPERERSAIATLGTVWEAGDDERTSQEHSTRRVGTDAGGTNRFERADARWRELSQDALADELAGPPGSGLIAAAGFSFSPQGARSPEWKGFEPASLRVPELALARQGAETWITVNAAVSGHDTSAAVIDRVARRLDELNPGGLPLLDPAPAVRSTVHSPMPPSHYEEAVSRAVERIRAGALEKLVLAREVQVLAAHAHDPAALHGALRGTFPGCFVYAVGRGAATFLGATPELLVRRSGQRASTVALAGSIRRSSDPAVDEHLGAELLASAKNRMENQIVVKRIAQALAPFSVWVAAAPEPVLVRVANIQHLGVPIRAQLRGQASALTLAGALHPTPAVGGEPTAAAEPLIPALEGFDRGWYAGTVGWVDTGGDGEFCVALRCALLRGEVASCYAGCGVVAGSDAGAELAETETKLQALLTLLSVS